MKAISHLYLTPLICGIVGWIFFLLYILVMFIPGFNPARYFDKFLLMLPASIGFLSATFGFIWGIVKVIINPLNKRAWVGILVSTPLFALLVFGIYITWRGGV